MRPLLFRFRFMSPMDSVSGVLCFCLLLSGCASKMTKEGCEKTDFYTMGIKDGEDGKGNERFDRINQECQAVGFNANAQNYTNGRIVGLASFCTESRGTSDAKKNSPNGSCMEIPPYKTAYSHKLQELKADSEKKLSKLQKSERELKEEQGKLQGDVNKIDSQQQAVPKQ